MERMVRVDPHYQLWVEDRGDPEATALLLIMGANASGIAWPEPLVDQLAEQHRVVCYDHRDTGRSTWAFDTHPYAVRDLAEDAVSVLDAVGINRVHVVGMSMDGTLVQLLLLDPPTPDAQRHHVCHLRLGREPSRPHRPKQRRTARA